MIPKWWVGLYYTALHYAMVAVNLYAAVFSQSPVVVGLVLLFFCADLASIVLFRGCPLTHLEQYYLAGAPEAARQLSMGDRAHSMFGHPMADPRIPGAVPSFMREMELVLHAIVLVWVKLLFLVGAAPPL